MSGGDDGKAQHEADALVRRAYGVQDQDEALALYRDWATTYKRSMQDSYYFERAEPEGQYCLVRRL